MTGAIRESAFSGIRWTAISYTVAVLLNLLQIAILARFLTPADFGVFAVVMASLGILQIFADAGVSNAIIHEKSISADQLSTLFWLNLIVGIALALALVAGSGQVANLVKSPELGDPLALAALTIAIRSAGNQPLIVAQKNLRFRLISIVEIAASITGFGVAVVLASAGAGVYSFVWGLIAASGVRSGLAWLLASGNWRPTNAFNPHRIRHMLRYGLFHMGDGLLNMIGHQADIIVGSRYLGAGAIGPYSISKDLSLKVAQAINPIVTKVGLPIMAKVQHDVSRVRYVYLRTVRMTASVNFPVYTLIFVFAPEITAVFLGQGWSSVTDLLRVFSVWGLIRSSGSTVGSLLLALGHVERGFRWNLVWLLPTVGAVFVGVRYGTVGLAVGLLAIQILRFIPSWYYLIRPLCGGSLAEYANQSLIPLALATLSALAAYVSVLPVSGDILRLFVGACAAAIAYCLLSYRFNRYWFDSMRELLQGRSSAPVQPFDQTSS